MIAISRAVSAEDFEIAARFNKISGEWDAAEARAYGIPGEIVMALFHDDDDDSLVRRFNGERGHLFIARWNGAPAGSLGFETFDDTTLELQKVFVDPHFRRKGIGQAMMQTALREAQKGAHTRMLLQTTIYMKEALSLYETFGFVRCPPFRDIPDEIKHTEVFMQRAL